MYIQIYLEICTLYKIQSHTYIWYKTNICFIYYIKLKSRLSVRTFPRHVNYSVVSASIETGLAPNKTYVFWRHGIHLRMKVLSAVDS